MATSAYSDWTREQLLERVLALEEAKRRLPTNHAAQNRTMSRRKGTLVNEFEFYSHPRRKIALKFSYSGWEYGGLAYQPIETPLPTVEGVLFETLSIAHLVNPEAGLEGCGWERCGRTDRGVSGARQVVSLWVRSALSKEQLAQSDTRPGPILCPPDSRRALPDDDDAAETTVLEASGVYVPEHLEPQVRSEHDYVSILNRLLPDTIRVSAWSPVPVSFSARFSCTYRHYKYFFTANDLDLPRMKDAANRLVGEHDFRNLCKIDPAKQITTFKRNVVKAHIEKLNDNIHVFNLIGSAFLYHQVRHIMAVLFLIGSGLEKPSLITQLMNVTQDEEPLRDDDRPYEIVDRKPEYQMADGLPLMLWDCGYPEGTFTWRTTGKPDAGSTAISDKLREQMANTLVRSHIYSALNEHFLMAAGEHHLASLPIFPIPDISQLAQRKGPKDAVNLHLGGGTHKRMVKYKPVLQRNRIDPVEVINERWRLKAARKPEVGKTEAASIGVDKQVVS